MTGEDHVHLTVFTPGKPGKRVTAADFLSASEHPISENVAGCYQEWDIPHDPAGAPGTWRWPTRPSEAVPAYGWVPAGPATLHPR